MHNNIIAAGSRDRPPMLATGRYAQWQSRFLRYIDTRTNGDALRKCILQGPYTPTTVIIPAVPAIDDTPAVPEQTTVKTILTMLYKPTNNNFRTSSNTKNKNVDNFPRYKNDNQTGQFGNQRIVNVAGARETVSSQCKQAEKGVQLQVEQSDWLEDTDEEIDEQELEAHYSYMAKIQEIDQNAEVERAALANLIVNLKLDVDKNKKIQKQLRKANASLTQELKEELVDQAWVKHSHDHFRAPTTLDMEVLIKTCLMPLAIKTQNDSFTFVHELKQEMHADLKYVESLENEIDELESDKAEFSNMYDILLQECVSNDVMCSYLHSLSDLDAHNELQCLYLHKVKECECLAQKLSKQTESVSKEVYTELL
ncbi:hypothetical protein Tco_0881280 [Tanacetum coccineum]